MPDNYEPRILVQNKHTQHYSLWVYEEKDWKPGRFFTDDFKIIAWAHTQEERDVLNAFVEYYTNLTKENQHAIH